MKDHEKEMRDSYFFQIFSTFHNSENFSHERKIKAMKFKELLHYSLLEKRRQMKNKMKGEVRMNAS